MDKLYYVRLCMLYLFLSIVPLSWAVNIKVYNYTQDPLKIVLGLGWPSPSVVFSVPPASLSGEPGFGEKNVKWFLVSAKVTGTLNSSDTLKFPGSKTLSREISVKVNNWLEYEKALFLDQLIDKLKKNPREFISIQQDFQTQFGYPLVSTTMQGMPTGTLAGSQIVSTKTDIDTVISKMQDELFEKLRKQREGLKYIIERLK